MIFTTDSGVLPATNFNYLPVNIAPGFSVQYVANYLRNINAYAAAGLDGLPGSFWKSIHLALSVPLSLIYNASFYNGKLQSN